MAAEITISEATASDLTDIVSVRCESEEAGLLSHFIYGQDRIERIRKQTASLMLSLGRRFTHPTNRCYIHKATHMQTGETVGFSLVRWEDGTWLVPPPDPSADGRMDFTSHYQREVKKNWIKLLPDKQPHVVLGALHIRPDWQGRGIGKRLIENIYSQYDLDTELVIVQTNPIAEGFYKKLGWVTVDSTDIDLSEWGGKGMGYGLHRSPQMLRYPRSSGSDAANA